MSNERAWEEKYTIRSLADVPEPAAFLRDYAHLLGSAGTALDIAMGAGQNAVFLAQRGIAVTGVDRSRAAVAMAEEYARDRGAAIDAVAADMLDWPFPENYFDVILDFYFLERALVPRIKAGLKKGGLLFFETYTVEQQRFDGPHNTDFLLKPNELLETFLDLFILFYHERIESDGKGGYNALASMIAKKV
jgi:2-polyprenyl-3-methyl-5-hydroxy-6-metoxy-1,4-benzoquinol methylase